MIQKIWNTERKKIAEELKIANPRTHKFYTTAEIQKLGKPRRSIVSLTNSPASKRWKFVEFHLQPIVTEIPSYVQDTKNFLKKRKET